MQSHSIIFCNAWFGQNVKAFTSYVLSLQSVVFSSWGTPLIHRIALSFFLAACFTQAAPPVEKTDPDSSQSELRAVIERYSADRVTLARTYPIEFSPNRQARMKQFYAEWLGRLAELNFESMSPEGRIDYLLLRNHLQHEQRQLDLQNKFHEEEAPFLPFAPAILSLEDARRRMGPINSAKAAHELNDLAKQVDASRQSAEVNLRSGNMKKSTANRAADTLQGMRNILHHWFDFYNGYDPLFTWWAAEPFKAADTALQNYGTFLRERVAGVRTSGESGGVRRGAGGTAGGRGVVPTQTAAQAGDSDDIVGNPIGRDGLMSELAYEMIPYTPEELIAIANKEFAWCEEQMKRASRDLGYGDDWHKALEHVKTLYVEPGKQTTLIRDLANEAIAFLDQHDLITIPPLARESWRMEMMSPEGQLVNPFFTGGEVISVSYPTSGMSEEQKLMSMRGNNIHFSRATVFHELQGFIAQRYRTHRRLFSTPFLGEGWSLYWELLMWDMNFAKSPENKIGMLFWRMHRCARIIFSLSFHLQKMTPQECIDFLVNRVGHERENAIGEVRRSFNGSYGPLYQAAYLLGGMQLHALRKELVDSGKMTDRAFHDAVLRENSIPVEMIRASLTNQKLTKDFSTSWKFYGN
jgi:uncharacterized protein (DUF885 family)